MPGLFGYADRNDRLRDDRILNAMRELLIYVNKDSHKSEPYYHDDNGVHAGYCAPSFETVDDHTCESDGVACWFDGEVYNMEELVRGRSISIPPNNYDIKNIIITAYKNNALTDLLRKIDGYFSAVIYDKEKRQVKLMTDRFGFRHICYTRYNNKFAWASECKAFIGLPDFKINVDRRSVEEFMKFGMLCEDRTWLDGVYLLDPAMVLTYDDSMSLKMERYWSSDEIVPFDGGINIDECYEEWGRLLRRSVERRMFGERVGITLSGGLDSRGLLAAMPSGVKFNAATLGHARCYDARFATMAAKVKDVDHYIFPMEYDGWFERACLGVWATDGALTFASQQGIEHLDAMAGLFAVSLNGLGGSSVMQAGMSPASSHRGISDGLEGGVPGAQMIDRRMLRAGFRLDESFIKIRMPYYGNELYDFVTSLPLRVRCEGLFYRNALLHNFPEYYRNIPWQQAGVPIGLPSPLFAAAFFCNRVSSRVKRRLRRFGLPIFDPKLCFNIPEALHYPGNNVLAEKILTDRDAIYPQYIGKDAAVGAYHKYAYTEVERRCRVLTFEVFMRRLTDRHTAMAANGK